MKFSILLTFYKSFCALTIGISIFTCVLLQISGDSKYIVTFLWTKLITNALAILFLHLFDRDKLYFYFNLGYSARRLYAVTFGFDLLIWLLLILLTSAIL